MFHLISVHMNAQTCEECGAFIDCPTWIRQESFCHLSEAFPLLRDHSPNITLIKSEQGLSKKKLDVLGLRHSCCIPIQKEWPFYRDWEESIYSHSSASLMQEECSETCLPQPCSCLKTAKCHEATGVGQDPTLIHR